MDQFIQFVIHHWQLWVALAIILVLILINETRSQKNRAQEISPAAAVDLMNDKDAAVIDLRDAEAYRNGHILNSIRASLDDFKQTKFDKYKSKPVILVCAQGVQARTQASKLQGVGFNEVYVLSGGISAWSAASLPLVKGKK